MNTTSLAMTQATIEIFGGFICLMLTVIITMTGYKRSSWKLLRWMFFTISIIFLSEACGYIFTGNAGRTAAVMNQISNFGVFFLNLVLVDLSMHYIYQLLQEKGVVPDRIFINIVRVCIEISGLILVTNFYTKWMYYFDDTNQYHRNTGWYIYAAINLICILVCSIMCIRYRKAIKKTTFVSLLVYTFTPLLAIILQAFLYGISITNIGIFITLILMLLAYLKEWSRIREGEEKKRKLLDIVVLFTIMAISMSVSVVSCIVSINRISDKNSQSNSMLIAHMVNDSIENKFLKPVIVSETMSNDYSLKQYMKKSGESSPEAVEKVVASYLDSIRTGFGYQMVYAVCDASKAYYSYNGISKFVDPENDEHDIWYRTFLEEGKHYDLEVDTDEANHWELSVFVNTEITDENGNFLGVCGIGVEMKNLQRFLKQYEEKYNVKIDLIDKTGLIQVDSEAARIERDYLDSSYLQNVNADEFYYEEGAESSRMTKYMEDLDWYLVVEDCNPDKINVFELVTTSIVIFIIGLMMMGIVFAVIFIRERKASREIAEKRRISITDDMTGLFNRRAYEEDCAKILEKGIVSEVTLIMMDVNSLKSVNDTYGHMAGDELIIGAAKCILTSMGEYGKVYRIGGDEFVALLKCTAEQLDDMLHTFDHLTEKWKGNGKYRLSISKGIVVCKDHGNLTFDEMKELADRLMYEDKDEYYKHTGRERRKT
ncbi:MAG: diguanylate cyclase [Eubacterium sp.]|nr:diguanylate cyclase [Eubacterium sp.]